MAIKVIVRGVEKLGMMSKNMFAKMPHFKQ